MLIAHQMIYVSIVPMAAKKSAVKKGVTKSKPKKIVEKAPTEVKSSKFRKFTKNKKTTKLLIKAIALLLLLLLLYLGRSLFVAAIVGNRPITRISLIQELEKQSGQQALDNLITKELIYQEASKQNINIGSEEVTAEIDKIKSSLESQGTTLDAALSMQGQTRESLEENIRVQKTLEKVLQSDIEVSDEELSKYFEENKSLYGEGAKYEDLKENIKEQLKQEKLSTVFQTWIEKLRSDTKIIYFVNY